MTTAHFTVAFDGQAPDELKVGDTIRINGTVTVRQIQAELVDITGYGRDHEYTLGGITIDLVSNHLEVDGI